MNEEHPRAITAAVCRLPLAIPAAVCLLPYLLPSASCHTRCHLPHAITTTAVCSFHHRRCLPPDSLSSLFLSAITAAVVSSLPSPLPLFAPCHHYYCQLSTINAVCLYCHHCCCCCLLCAVCLLSWSPFCQG